MSQDLLIVGADGLLGRALVAAGRARGLTVIGTRRTSSSTDPATLRLDLSEPLGAWQPPAGCQVAFLGAAVTRLEACHANPAATREINVVRTLELARRLADHGVFVLFPSSNLVFDGTRPCPSDDATLCPTTEYGRQKAEVEEGLRSLGSPSAIVRLTKVIHNRWPLLVAWREALANHQAIHPFSDLRCAPVPLDLVVDGLLRIALGRWSGVWQFSPGTDIAYADLALHLAHRWDAPRALVQPVTAGNPGGLDHRAPHTTLNALRAFRELGLVFPEPLVAIDRALAA